MFGDAASDGNGAQGLRREFACPGQASGRIRRAAAEGAGPRTERTMIFEAVATGGCRSYLIGCEQSCAGALIDPELSQIDRYIALASRHGLRIRYLVDTHTHADHFSATQQLAQRFGVPAVMHSASPAPFVELRLRSGELLRVGQLRLQRCTPRVTRAIPCVCASRIASSPATRC